MGWLIMGELSWCGLDTAQNGLGEVEVPTASPEPHGVIVLDGTDRTREAGGRRTG